MLATKENIELFKKVYDDTKSLRTNIKLLEGAGLNISIRTVRRWRYYYILQKPIEENPNVRVSVPREFLDEVLAFIGELKNNKNNK